MFWWSSRAAKSKAKPVEVRPCRLDPQLQKVGGKSILRVDCTGCFANASFGNPACMEGILKTFSEKNEPITELVLRKSYNKVFSQSYVNSLKELANMLKKTNTGGFCAGCKKILSTLWGDPVYTYYKLKERDCRKCRVEQLLAGFERSSIVKSVIRGKGKYTDILEPELVTDIVSSFVDQKLPKNKPEAGYTVVDVAVSIHKLDSRPDMYYFLRLPELSLKKEELEKIHEVFRNLNAQRKIIDLDPEKVRDEFSRHIDTILENLGYKEEANKLGKILLRHTVGYGVIEPLLLDEKIQDVFVDSGSPQVHIVHSDFGECLTNIYMTQDEIEKLSTRLRALSKRPLDASSPVLHTELQDLGVRVCGICEPSTYRGTGFAFRKRKVVPWTLTELAYNKMMDPKIAGLLSYLVENQNSILITGPRSSGKTSLLTALILEMPRSSRIILIEDTPEIPVAYLRSLGFKIEHLKTEAFAKGFEISAEDALRTSLRLGDSILVVGEVRGPEAKTLFEAMRIGAAGNVVLGTIHGSNAYDTFDRVIHDLGVPPTSFKAVDFVLTAGLVKKGDSIRKSRKLLEVAELLKDWTKKPEFKQVAAYNSLSDSWTVNLKKSAKLKSIAKTKSVGVVDVKKSIDTRAKIKGDILRLSKQSKRLLSPYCTVGANSLFTKLAGERASYKKIRKDIRLWLGKY